MIPISLAEVPSLHWFTRFWGHKFCSIDERGLKMRFRELLKHTTVRELAVWSSTHKGQIWIGSRVPAPGGENDCTL